MDDDIWGRWFQSLDFFVEKVNFLENGKSIEDVDEFYLMNQFTSDQSKLRHQMTTQVYIHV